MVDFVWFETTEDAVERQRNLVRSGFKGALVYQEIQPVKFAQMLAKIAHAYGVANVGLSGFKPYLTSMILGLEPNIGRYVGCIPPHLPTPPPFASDSPHRIIPHNLWIGETLVVGVEIGLFRNLFPESPSYFAIIGEDLLTPR